MKTNEIELLNTVINHAYSAGYVCGLDEGKTTHKATVENYENCIHHLKERIDLLKGGDNETTGTDI